MSGEKPKVKFIPISETVDVDPGTKILVVARRHKIPIRFGCGACRCGTCGVKVQHQRDNLSQMQEDERKLLAKMTLPTDGTIRLACRAKVQSGHTIVDLDFQDTYTPHDFSSDEEP